MRHRDKENRDSADDSAEKQDAAGAMAQADEDAAPIGKFAFGQTCLHGMPSVTGFCEH